MLPVVFDVVARGVRSVSTTVLVAPLGTTGSIAAERLKPSRAVIVGSTVPIRPPNHAATAPEDQAEAAKQGATRDGPRGRVSRLRSLPSGLVGGLTVLLLVLLHLSARWSTGISWARARA